MDVVLTTRWSPRERKSSNRRTAVPARVVRWAAWP